MNRVFNENCLDTMDRFPANFIDLTVTSPPYDNLRMYKGYSFEFEKIADELYRVTKKNGVLVWVVNDATVKGGESGTSFRQALYFMSLGFSLHDTMIWDKVNVFGTAGNPGVRYQQAFEYIFVFSKGKPKTINLIRDRCLQIGKVYSGTTRRDRRSNKTTDCLKVLRNIANKDTKIVNNIFKYPVGFNRTSCDKIAFEHPAIFPEALAKDHILTWSNPGDIVYDPLAGSGTTAKMTLLCGRQFIATEMASEYIPIINARIAPVLAKARFL